MKVCIEQVKVTLTVKNLAPSWLACLLAGTYWRNFAYPENAIHDYSQVPHQCEDAVFTNLVDKIGPLDEALAMMKVAITKDDKEPDSNFFISNLDATKVSVINIKEDLTDVG